MVIGPEEAKILNSAQRSFLKKLETIIDKWLVAEVRLDGKEFQLPFIYNPPNIEPIINSPISRIYFPKEMKIERKVFDLLMNGYREKKWIIREFNLSGEKVGFYFKINKEKN